MRGFQPVELGVADHLRESGRRLALDQQPQMKCVAHELDVDTRDLQPALWGGVEQAFGFEPGITSRIAPSGRSVNAASSRCDTNWPGRMREARICCAKRS